MDGIKALMVDDDPSFLELSERFLGKEDIKAEKETSPREAVKRLSREGYDQYDVILSDLDMPEMDGLEFLDRVRENSDIPFFMLTGKERNDIFLEAKSGGADGYFQKDIGDIETQYSVIASDIRQAVEKRRTEQSEEELREEIERLRLMLKTSSHDAKNYQNRMQGYFQLLESELNGESPQSLDKLREAIDENGAFIEKFDSIYRIQEIEDINSLNLDSIVRNCIEELDNVAENYGIDLEYSGEPQMVEAGPMVNRMIHNVIENSIEHSGADRIDLYMEEIDEEYLRLVVEDDGQGFPEEGEDIFYSPEKGGMGSYIIGEIANQYGVDIEIDSDGPGTRIEFYFEKTMGPDSSK